MLKGRTVTHITGYDAACVLALGSTLPVEEPALDFCCQSVFTTEVNKAVGNLDSNDVDTRWCWLILQPPGSLPIAMSADVMAEGSVGWDLHQVETSYHSHQFQEFHVEGSGLQAQICLNTGQCLIIEHCNMHPYTLHIALHDAQICLQVYGCAIVHGDACSMITSS